MANAVDIAPNYAGLIFGLSQTLGSIPAFVSPILTGYLIHEKEHFVESWQWVWYATGIIACGGTIFFCIVGQGYG